MKTQARAAEAAAVLVVTKATPAMPLAARALPLLKPNHPNQSSAVPRSVIGRLCGGIGSRGNPLLLPMTRQATRADMPELMGTTGPPAKSRAPIPPIQPPPHTQWQRGSYTTVAHTIANMTRAENFILSA